MQWLMAATENDKIQAYFRDGFPVLKEDEGLLEFAFSLEKYRGMRIMPHARPRLQKRVAISGRNISSLLSRRKTSHRLKDASGPGFSLIWCVWSGGGASGVVVSSKCCHQTRHTPLMVNPLQYAALMRYGAWGAWGAGSDGWPVMTSPGSVISLPGRLNTRLKMPRTLSEMEVAGIACTFGALLGPLISK